MIDAIICFFFYSLAFGYFNSNLFLLTQGFLKSHLKLQENDCSNINIYFFGIYQF